MIKVFRNIRRSLVNQGNTGKYIKYAFGEIILVMIGILLALQVSNWNQEAANDQLELEALKNLREDFDFNLAELYRVDTLNTKNIKSCVIILNHTGNRQNAAFDINTYLNDAAASPDYVAKNGFLNDLVSSGNLGLVKNKALRNMLSSWPAQLNVLQLREAASEQSDIALIEFVIKNGSWLKVDELRGFSNSLDITLPKSGFDIDNGQLLKLPEFENRIENQIMFFNIVKEIYGECILLNKAILRLLEKEIMEKQ